LTGSAVWDWRTHPFGLASRHQVTARQRDQQPACFCWFAPSAAPFPLYVLSLSQPQNRVHRPEAAGMPSPVCDRLARFGPTHRSNLERSIRRALNWQFMDLPTAAWRCGRLKWVPRFAAPESETFPEKRRRLNRSPPNRSRGRPHPVASDTGMARVGFRFFPIRLSSSTRERLSPKAPVSNSTLCAIKRRDFGPVN